jgi:hypothetical protein
MGGLRAGILYLQVNGKMYDAKGEFEYNLGLPKRTSIVGADGVHGFCEEPQESYISGAITDAPELSLDDLVKIKDATATLSLANGKTILIPGATYAGEGTVKTKEAEIGVKFIGSGPGREV